MKRFLTYMTGAAVILMLAGSTGAVEKRSKTAPKKPAVTKTQKPSTQTPAAQGQRQSKKYDSFVDRNNNGIDDRQEKAKPKASESASSKKTVKDKPVTSDSSGKRAATESTTKK